VNPFFQSLATFFGPTIATIVACLAIALAAYAYQNLVQLLPQSMREHVDAIAQMAVRAVEQRYSNADPGATTSRQKKNDALSIMNSVAGALKIPMDAQHASAAIEAAVYALNQREPRVSAQPTVKTPALTAGEPGDIRRGPGG